MTPRIVLLAALLALAVPSAEAAGPVATVRVAFDRDGITDTRVRGMADVAAGRAVTREPSSDRTERVRGGRPPRPP